MAARCPCCARCRALANEYSAEQNGATTLADGRLVKRIVNIANRIQVDCHTEHYRIIIVITTRMQTFVAQPFDKFKTLLFAR